MFLRGFKGIKAIILANDDVSKAKRTFEQRTANLKRYRSTTANRSAENVAKRG